MRLYSRIFAALSVLVIAFAFSGCEKYYNYNLDKYVTVEDYEIADLPKLEEVTDEDVLNKIKGEFSSFVTEQVVTGVEIKEEDYVTVSVDCYNSETSKVIEELKYDALVVKVGSLYVAEGFSEKFIGCKSGDNVEFSLTLDESHEKFGLNGVEVRFVCLIKNT